MSASDSRVGSDSRPQPSLLCPIHPHSHGWQVDYLGSQLLQHFDIPLDSAEVAEAPEDGELVLARMKARLETEGEGDDAEEEDTEV